MIFIEEKQICGINVEDALLPELKKYSDISLDWLKENYNSFSKDMREYIDNITK